jgi:hypothetical protein
VTGASGAGKTAAVRALEARRLPGVRCYHFDSIGVPTAAVMDAEYGGGEQWQAAATTAWLRRLRSEPEEVRVAVLDGQTRPSVVLADGGGPGTSGGVHVALLDCAPEVRAARLCGPRGQPELATARMDAWAAYLRGQADALGLAVIDTTELTVEAVADRLAELVGRMTGAPEPAA